MIAQFVVTSPPPSSLNQAVEEKTTRDAIREVGLWSRNEVGFPLGCMLLLTILEHQEN